MKSKSPSPTENAEGVPITQPRVESSVDSTLGSQPTPPNPEGVPSPSPKSRKDILDEAAIKLGTGVKNSAEQVAYWCMYDNPDQIRTQYKLLRERLAEVHAILRDQIENLPEL